MSKELVLRSDALTADEVEQVTFGVTRFKQGYDPKEVDDFLDRVQSEVAKLTEENQRLQEALATAEIARKQAEVARSAAEKRTVSEPSGAVLSGSADLLARRADLERDVNALEAFEREYRTRLRAWIGGMLDELDHPDDVPVVTTNPTTLSAAPTLPDHQWNTDDTDEIPVIDEKWLKKNRKEKKRKAKNKKKSKKSFRSDDEVESDQPRAYRDFTLPPDDPHGPDSVVRPA